MKFSGHLYLALVFIDFISITYSVPHEFCLDPFDDRDCYQPPVRVFYYYKAGSRCEVMKWRGCPTRNKFPDEQLCSHYCIGRLFGYVDETEVGYNRTENEIALETKEDWEEELNGLNIEEIDNLNKILDEIIEGTDHTPHKIGLSWKYNRTTTEANIDSTTEVEELPSEEPKGEVTEGVTEPEPKPETEEPTGERTEEPTEASDAPETEAPHVTEGASGSAEEVVLP